MNHSLRSFTLAVLSGAVLTFSACSKDETTPTTANGTIAGQITPANAITTVTATPATGTASTATPTSTGAYTFANVAPGSYTVTYTPATGYAAPAAQTATVTAGNTTTLTPVTVATASTTGTVSFSINGTAMTPSVLIGSYSNNTLTVGGSSATGAVSVIANAVTGPGSYPISFGSCAAGTNGYLISGGTMVVTSLNTTTRKASGTFTATGTAILGTGTVTVTNGVFTNLSLQ